MKSQLIKCKTIYFIKTLFKINTADSWKDQVRLKGPMTATMTFKRIKYPILHQSSRENEIEMKPTKKDMYSKLYSIDTFLHLPVLRSQMLMSPSY